MTLIQNGAEIQHAGTGIYNLECQGELRWGGKPCLAGMAEGLLWAVSCAEGQLPDPPAHSLLGLHQD